LIWPGGLFGGGGNFGVPQLLSIAGAIRKDTSAAVDVIDLDVERVMGRALREQLSGYDLVGISCYSSYDYLKVLEIARIVREALPKAWIVTGGYHASAKPNEFDDPIDFVCVGDGERPMARLVTMLESGKRPLLRELPQEPTPHPDELPPYDWELLAKYKPIARRAASQAEIYLSRGCPYDCAFCMERAKRDTSWRALDPDRAVEEMHRLDRFLDLSNWTLFIADALFGMKDKWRKQFLEGLARKPIRARKTWLLIRLDLIDREDLELMAKANMAPGFGLESGDPAHLKRIRKAGKLDSYLDKMLEVANWARQENVPFGANIIVGHPGETERSMRTSAAYMRKLFLDDRGTMGFLSVDPFRLYPGSPIDEERERWERDTGMKVHRWPWWHDGDQEFLSEWVDASSELDYRTTQKLRRELFDPIVREIQGRFSYRGIARDYFMRAVDEQVDLVSPKRMLHQLGMWHLWKELVEEPADRLDPELAEIARMRREEIVLFPCSERVRNALLAVPRERFVRAEDVADSAEDRALALSDDGRSTISALHAYAMAFDALDLSEGDDLVELGSGSGYGVAIARHVVGPKGSVRGFEIVPELAEWANVRCADAHDVTLWKGATKVSVGFALDSIPRAWIDALAPRGKIVAPVGSPQTLTLFEKLEDGNVRTSPVGPVRYVRDRASA
jgi:protein-L-isoaspartate(D-aspartate) O-methyltransferase